LTNLISGCATAWRVSARDMSVNGMTSDEGEPRLFQLPVCRPTVRNRRICCALADQKRWERIHGPHSLGPLGPAIRRDDIVHAQLFHELALVILGGIARTRANLRIPFGALTSRSPRRLPCFNCEGNRVEANRARDHGCLRGQIFWRS
jgi:hypothetical protein